MATEPNKGFPAAASKEPPLNKVPIPWEIPLTILARIPEFSWFGSAVVVRIVVVVVLLNRTKWYNALLISLYSHGYISLTTLLVKQFNDSLNRRSSGRGSDEVSQVTYFSVEEAFCIRFGTTTTYANF